MLMPAQRDWHRPASDRDAGVPVADADLWGKFAQLKLFFLYTSCSAAGAWSGNLPTGRDATECSARARLSRRLLNHNASG